MSNDNLHSVLEEETENKTPGNTTSTMWNFDNVEEAKEVAEDQAENINREDPDKKAEPKPGDKKITDKAKHASARVATGMLDMLQKSIFTPIISHKYKKKFTEDEINALDEKNLIDREKNELAGDDLLLRNKWDRLMGKCMKKIDDVPLTDPEKDDLNEAFYTYFDFKEKTLPPEWFVGFALINTIGKRLVDVVTD